MGKQSAVTWLVGLWALTVTLSVVAQEPVAAGATPVAVAPVSAPEAAQATALATAIGVIAPPVAAPAPVTATATTPAAPVPSESPAAPATVPSVPAPSGNAVVPATVSTAPSGNADGPVPAVPVVAPVSASVVADGGIGPDWTPINSATELGPDFFFDVQEKAPIDGKTFFALCTIRDGLASPGCYAKKEKSMAESLTLSAAQGLKLTFPGNNEVLISTADGLYWKINKDARSIEFTDLASAAKFQIYTNAKKDTVFLKVEEFFVRAHQNKDGDWITLSPMLVARSFFRSWKFTKTITKENIDASRHAIDLPMIQARRKATTTSRAWVAYDLAVAVLLKRDFKTLILENANGWDIAMAVDHATTLMTTTPLLEEYQKLYPSLGKGLPDDFRLFDWTSAVKYTADKSPWQSAIHIAQKLPHSETNPIRDNFRTLAFASLYVANFQASQQLVPFHTPIVLEGYFAASCNLAWLAPDRKNLTLAQLVEYTAMPNFGNNALINVHYPINGIEQYWFTKLLSPEVKSLNYSATTIFPEIALLKHLNASWVSEHSTIGEGIARFALRQFDSWLKEYELGQIIDYFKDPAAKEVVDALKAVCKPNMRISACTIPQMHAIAQKSDSFLSARTDPLAVVELKSISTTDLQKYNTLIKRDSTLGDLVDQIAKTKTEAASLTTDFFSQVAEKMEDATLATMMKTNEQVRADAVATFEQVKTSAAFSMNLFQNDASTQLQIAKDKFNAAIAVRPKYLENLEALATKAMKQAEMRSYFSIAKSVLSFGDIMQTAVAQPYSAMNSLSGFQNGLMDMNQKLMQWNSAESLKKNLQNAIPQLESIAKVITDAAPALEKLRNLVVPLVAMKDISNVGNMTDDFQEEYNKVKRLDLTIQISQVRVMFAQTSTQMCTIIQLPAYPPCVDILKHSTEYFGNLQESIAASNEALASLGGVLDSAYDVTAASDAHDSLTTDGDRDLEGIKQIAGENKDEQDKAKFRARKQIDTDQAYFTLSALQGQATYLQKMYQLCARIGYANGGMVPDSCSRQVMAFKRVRLTELNSLLSYKPDTRRQTENSAVYIPTVPQFPNDTGYIDLGELMNGHTVKFQLPQNYTWLQRFGWVNEQSDFKNSVIYLKQFKLMLPPRYTDFNEEVMITIKSNGKADLGPALTLGRYYTLPASKYVVSYGTKQCTSDAVANPYATCGAPMKELCYQTQGESESFPDLIPTLFSEFKISAYYANAKGSKEGFAYRSLASPLYLRAVITTEIAEVQTATQASRRLRRSTPSSQHTEKRRHLREMEVAAAEAAATRCCPMGSYAMVWTKAPSPQCIPCPAGSVSQLGGVFCAYTYSNNAAKSSTAAASTENLEEEEEEDTEPEDDTSEEETEEAIPSAKATPSASDEDLGLA
ncbi:hypothetical protein Poli38472_000910 [Pythium oligandrum]|uniref:Uncharacterized protein n=1 Tax=Pythium oligandrum TaxID=41045 RepID=A0A8K1FJL8_PYTOL|nr:hypothetical protein Poli38472_000910 [Pythium oligandrum]|eukprot:TMW60868.1 hypothetical protein Poli38472_000910 [Pythium oligandrum]